MLQRRLAPPWSRIPPVWHLWECEYAWGPSVAEASVRLSVFPGGGALGFEFFRSRFCSGLAPVMFSALLGLWWWSALVACSVTFSSQIISTALSLWLVGVTDLSGLRGATIGQRFQSPAMVLSPPEGCPISDLSLYMTGG
ncbi:hypothetical protein Bca4012_033041 [Brassica carinata]